MVKKSWFTTYVSGSFEEDTELPVGLKDWNKEKKEGEESGGGDEEKKLPSAV